jgi:hypothetical protein
LSSVVLPAPKKPLSTLTGSRAGKVVVAVMAEDEIDSSKIRRKLKYETMLQK